MSGRLNSLQFLKIETSFINHQKHMFVQQAFQITVVRKFIGVMPKNGARKIISKI